MIYHYIYRNQFYSSDEELTLFPMGTTLQDYLDGKMVLLNDQQIQYENEHPQASPEEVWEMQPIGLCTHLNTPENLMTEYFETLHNIIYINDEIHHCWNHRDIIYAAECAKYCGENEFIFVSEGKYFKGEPDEIIGIMRQIGLYYYNLGIAISIHYKHLETEDINTYDYTTGLPEIPRFTIEEINVTNSI